MCMPPTARASSLHSPCSPHCSLPQLGVEAPFRDLVVFVEQGTKDGSTLLLPSEWVAGRRGDTPAAAGDESKEPPTGGEEGAWPLVTHGDCPVFIMDCLGHYITARPVVLIDEDGSTAAGGTPTLLLLNSMGGNCTLKVCVAAACRMMFAGKHEGNDDLYLHKTHVPT